MVLFILTLNACKKPQSEEPEVVPITPSDLTATLVSNTQATLSWVDKSTNEVGFKVERKTGNGTFGVIATTNADITTINDAGLTPNTTYTYRVYSFNNTGKSLSYTNEVTITTISLAMITTTAISDTTGVSAVSGGNITSDGGSAITTRGVVWGTSPAPTVSLATKTTDGSGTGQFSSRMEGLSKSTKYYARAYATNAAGTAYGNELSFTTTTVDLNSGLVAYYPFNGNANDESGNGNNGILNGVQLTSDRKNNSNTAYLFDGTNEIMVPHTNALNLTGDMSISAWFNSYGPPTFRTNHTIVAKRSSTEFNSFPFGLNINYQFGIITDYKKPMFVSSTSLLPFPNGYQFLQSTTDIINNSWNHILLTISGNQLKLFLNGILVLNTISDNQKRVPNQAPLLIGSGARNDKPSEQFVGKLDEIRIYNRALTNSELEILAKQ
jgi:hypothetical protein